MEIRARHWLSASGVAALVHAALVLGLPQSSPPLPKEVAVTIQLGEMGAPEGEAGGGGESAAALEADSAQVAAAEPDEAPVLVGTPTPPVAIPTPVKPKVSKPPEPVKQRSSAPTAKPVARTSPPKSRATSESKSKPPRADTASPAVVAKGPGRGTGTGTRGQGQAAGGSGSTKGAGQGAGSQGVANYQGTLAAWLNRHKRYPDRARRLRQQGTVRVSFTIDRQGRLISHRIVGASGYPLLDQEVDALVRRASPMPPFPAGLTQSQLTITVPISFNLR